MNRKLAPLAVVMPLVACGGTQTPTSVSEPPSAPTVVVTSARWEAPVPVADAGERPFSRCSPFTTAQCRLFYDRTGPAVAVNARGQTVALWQRYEGDAFRLVGSRVTSAGTWSDAERVTPETSVRSQQVFVDASGNAVAQWFDGSGAATSVGSAGGGWSPAQAAEPSEQFVMDEKGTLHSLFTRWREGLFWSRQSPGGAWSEAVMLQGQGPEAHPFIRDPRLAVTRGGTLHAVWVREFQSSVREEEWDEVWSSRMRPGQAWAPPTLIARFPRAWALSLGMAASDPGALASYMLWDGRDSHQVMEQHQAGGSNATPGDWTAPGVVSEPTPPPPDVRNADLTVVASDARGTLTLAWTEVTYGPSEGSRYEIRARRFSAAAGAWEHAQRIESKQGYLHDLFDLHVAASAAGDAVVLWVEQSAMDFGHRMWASVFVPGVGWSAPQALRDAYLMSEPALAMDGSGNAIVMWSEPEGDRTTIWSARLSAATAPAP